MIRKAEEEGEGEGGAKLLGALAPRVARYPIPPIPSLCCDCLS